MQIKLFDESVAFPKELRIYISKNTFTKRFKTLHNFTSFKNNLILKK